jgi:hypothetical protein
MHAAMIVPIQYTTQIMSGDSISSHGMLVDNISSSSRLAATRDDGGKNFNIWRFRLLLASIMATYYNTLGIYYCSHISQSKCNHHRATTTSLYYQQSHFGG